MQIRIRWTVWARIMSLPVKSLRNEKRAKIFLLLRRGPGKFLRATVKVHNMLGTIPHTSRKKGSMEFIPKSLKK